MSFKVWFLCVVAIAGIATTVAGPVWSRSKITEETDVVVDGTIIHEKKEIEKNCRHIKTTTTMPDGSSSISDEDYNSGVEIIQISNDTSVCFVRVISDEEKRQAAGCMQGLVKKEAGNTESGEEQLEEGDEVPAEFLSPEQRLLCAGKRIVSVEPASSEEGKANREKRACGYYILRYTWWECYYGGYCLQYARYYLVYTCAK